ncbi:hypothetical protein [Salinibacter ruber]|uniref:hypothetical protein n=1 Tax=Salinibacter ruber TaxID=146919 RepID=UPI002166CCCB|nr:hypothetical protein [Salinibacter ruber]MCS4223607.1 hypothetical protein [Salinibacter ruber]
MKKEVTSLDLHLKHQSDKVVETRKLKDVACGIYRSYYINCGNHIKASTSVVDLIAETDEIDYNNNFSRPSFLEADTLQRKKPKGLSKISSYIPYIIRSGIPESIKRLARQWNILSSTSHKVNNEFVDNRVNKLKPFEKVTLNNRERNFSPTFKLDSKTVLIKKTVEYITEFIHSVESLYPEHEHVVLVGGKDSQLILLAPKKTDNWSVFSSYPNYPLVESFVQDNNIPVKQLHSHPNQCLDTENIFKEKILASDMSVDPRHMRWRGKLKEIANRYDKKCIFWAGQLADTIYTYHKYYQEGGRQDYFEKHFRKAANQMGADHASIKNQVGVPMLSPYHSGKIWKALYQHYDPSIINKDTDLRPEIGEQLAGREIKWPESNPSPDIYVQDFDIDPVEYYIGEVKKQVSGNR